MQSSIVPWVHRGELQVSMANQMRTVDMKLGACWGISIPDTQCLRYVLGITMRSYHWRRNKAKSQNHLLKWRLFAAPCFIVAWSTLCMGYLECTKQILLWESSATASGHCRWSYWPLDRVPAPHSSPDDLLMYTLSAYLSSTFCKITLCVARHLVLAFPY